MRLVGVVGAALLAWGCADGESDLEPRTPVNAQLEDATCVPAPALEDGFPRVFAMAQEAMPPPERPRSISLGFIGDAPLGREPTAEHAEPSWTRPFPCAWTGECWTEPPPPSALPPRPLGGALVWR